MKSEGGVKTQGNETAEEPTSSRNVLVTLEPWFEWFELPSKIYFLKCHNTGTTFCFVSARNDISFVGTFSPQTQLNLP